MDIKILHSWLSEFVKTNATPKDIARCLSLCGPSVERVEKMGKDYLYTIEVTTNRVDMMGVIGIARETAVILPQFGFKARFIDQKHSKVESPIKNLPLVIKSNKELTNRVVAVVLDVENTKTPDWMKERLEMSGIRSLNSIVDITNYIMTEVGHPTHVFDYDRVKNHTLSFRRAMRGEKIVSLEEKTYELPGGDVVIDDGSGEIIDLPAIIGTDNSIVTSDTRRIIYFIDNINPVQIRKTSMTLSIRTVAATLNEKGVDPHLMDVALVRGLELYKKICKAKVLSKVHDFFPSPYKPHTVTATYGFITDRLGIEISQKEITNILGDLGFKVTWKKDVINVEVPSRRSRDVSIGEDIIEELARIYGYFRLPSILMDGKLPEKPINQPFDFEMRVKRILQNLGAQEVYTLSLVPKDYVDSKALRLKNPLGSDSEYLRTSLRPSLLLVIKENKGFTEPYYLFEIANVYASQPENLPQEKLMLAGVFENYHFRKAKGVVEVLLTSLKTNIYTKAEDKDGFVKSKRISFICDDGEVGEFGVLKSGKIYHEFSMESLMRASSSVSAFVTPSKFPPQIEDITLALSPKTKVQAVIDAISGSDKVITNVELIDIYENAHTFRVYYQDPDKTLTNEEVEKIRTRLLSNLKRKFNASAKD